jgi:hypothetical protein
MKESSDWIPLPDVREELYVGMIKELLDKENIPSWIKLSALCAGLSQAAAPRTAGKSWCILVPQNRYDQAVEIFEQIIGPANLRGD